MPKTVSTRRLRAMAQSFQLLLQQLQDGGFCNLSIFEDFLNFAVMNSSKFWKFLLDSRMCVPKSYPPKPLFDEFTDTFVQPYKLDRMAFDELMDLRRLVHDVGAQCDRRWHVRRRRIAELLEVIDDIAVKRCRRALPLDLLANDSLQNWIARAAYCRRYPGSFGAAGVLVAEEVTKQLAEMNCLSKAVLLLASEDDRVVTYVLQWLCGCWQELNVDAGVVDSLFLLLFENRDEYGCVERDVAILRLIRKAYPLIRSDRFEGLRHQLLKVIEKFYELHALRKDCRVVRDCVLTLEVMAEG